MAEPVRGVAYDFFLGLTSILDSQEFLVDPTIVAGDFQISKDGGAYVNLATLPVVLPAVSVSVLVSLSATEMDADKVVITAIDISADEWNDVFAFIDAPVANSQSAVDILEGDHIEDSTSLIINLKGTSTPVISKQIGGSLLTSGVTIRTLEAP